MSFSFEILFLSHENLGLNFFTVICYSLADLIPKVACLTAAKAIHHSFLRNVLRLPMCFFDTNPKGRLLARCSRDIEIVDGPLPRQLDGVMYFTLQVTTTIQLIRYLSKPEDALSFRFGFWDGHRRKIFNVTAQLSDHKLFSVSF
jgi:ABC-type multidrug transport system fused ATPase/permease subunit